MLLENFRHIVPCISEYQMFAVNSCKYGSCGHRLHSISKTLQIYPMNLYIFRNCVQIPRK